MIQILFSGSDDVEDDPQPTERTSSMSGPLRPEMGRIMQKTSSSDGDFRPNMEDDLQFTMCSSIGFLQPDMSVLIDYWSLRKKMKEFTCYTLFR